MKEVSKKILPKYFEDVKSGIKTFEVRKDEDDIQVGDILFLEEWKPDGIFTGGYTGRCIRKRVKYILRDIPQYGLQEGYCIIGLEDINGGWILCSSGKFPKDKERVFITHQIKGCPPERLEANYSKDIGWYDEETAELFETCEVIAWQPVLAPYQPKGE